MAPGNLKLSTRLCFYAVVLFGNTLELNRYMQLWDIIHTNSHLWNTSTHMASHKLTDPNRAVMVDVVRPVLCFMAYGQCGHGNTEQSCQLYRALNHIKEHSISPQHPTGACMMCDSCTVTVQTVS